MSHPDQKEFINILSKYVPLYFNNARVLEIGSLDINGTIRDYFNNCEYTGIDVGPGPGVDVVCKGQDYKMPDDFYDHVISCECMEHNPYWRETFLNMIRLCRPGGLVTMSCASIGRAEHGTARVDPDCSPLTVNLRWSYYKNLSSSYFRKYICFKDHFIIYRFWCNWGKSDLYFVGIKKSKDISADLRKKWEEYEIFYNKVIESNNSPTRAKLRKYIGTIFGDYGFILARTLKNII